MAAKKIAIGNGYEVQFTQRAKGQETPFWIGKIYKNGTEIGSFQNTGTGGATIIHPISIIGDLHKIFEEESNRQGFSCNIFERENEAIDFAYELGYGMFKGVDPVQAAAFYVRG